jgi:hypothetical protein
MMTMRTMFAALLAASVAGCAADPYAPKQNTGAAAGAVAGGTLGANKPDDFILAIVEFRDGGEHGAHYLRRPFQREPDFGVTSVNYDFAELLARGGNPS